MTESIHKSNIISTVKAYGKKLFGFIRGRVKSDEEAEDILQEVWYQASNSLNFEEIDSISGWLYRVARNKIIDRYRKKSEEYLEDFAFFDEAGDQHFQEILLSDVNDPELELLRTLFWEALEEALESLPEKQRQVFILNELEDLTLQQIADQTGENLKTIISRKRYAVLKLREHLRWIYDDFNDFD